MYTSLGLSETPSPDELNHNDGRSSAGFADESDARPPMAAVMADLEADADFVARMEDADALRDADARQRDAQRVANVTDGNAWPALPVLQPITRRCMTVNLAAWPLSRSSDGNDAA